MKVKAGVLYKANTPIEIKELKQGPPKSNEVKIKMLAAGVCASDHHVMKGETNFPMPIVLGHEGAGVVKDVGPGVRKVKAGDHVVLHWVKGSGIASTPPRDNMKV